MEIKNYKEINKGALVGKFDLYIPQWKITIRECAYMAGSNGNEWISFPSREYTDADTGAKKYYRYFMFDKDVDESVQKKILDKVKANMPKKHLISDEVETDELPF